MNHTEYMRAWRADPENARRQYEGQRDWHERNPGKAATYSAAYRAANPEKAAEHSATYRASPKGQASRAARLMRNRRWSWEYRQDMGCTDCGEDDPRVLEFDHVDGKSANVSQMVNEARSLESIIAEAARCEVRCRNCHFIVTLERQDAYSHRWFTEGVPWEIGSKG